MGLNFYGRRAIFSDELNITRENVLSVLRDAMMVHRPNREDILYLQDYEKGNQPILDRVKEVRPEINHKIVENHAASIVNFKTGYLFGSPINLVQRADRDSRGEPSETDDTRVSMLNEMLAEQGKSSKDQLLSHDFCTCGVGYRLVLPKRNKRPWEVSAFDIINLDPRHTFVVYSNDVYREPIMGVTYTTKNHPLSDIQDALIYRFGVYTKDKYYEIEGDKIVKETDNLLGVVPIVEYTYDADRMGAFEKVIPLLNALNLTASDRQNGLDQFIQSVLVITGTDLEQEDVDSVTQGGVLILPTSDADAKMLSQALDQTGVQSLVDHTLEQLEAIAAVPGKNANAQNTTGEAILLSSGWQLAETAARSEELLFKASEMRMLEVILAILRLDADVDKRMKSLALSDIEIKFSRNRTDALLTKVQALQILFASGIKNKHALDACGLWSDVQTVWDDSKDTILQEKKEDDNNVVDQLGEEPTSPAEGEGRNSDPGSSGEKNPEGQGRSA